MKKINLILLLALTVSITSCKDGKWFWQNEESNKNSGELVEENEKFQREIDSLQNLYESEIMQIRTDYERKLANLQQELEAGKVAEKGAYYVIVGSFKNRKYAEEYAGKIKQMGGEGNIIQGPNNFLLVTEGSYSTLNSALSPLTDARQKLASKAWVFFND